MTTQHNVHLTPKSGNKKTGPIPVTTSSRHTCPDSCPLKRSTHGNGCYADGGPLALHWNKVTAGERGATLTALCEQIAAFPAGQLWRHNQAGDLPGTGNRINTVELFKLVRANTGRKGFTYTHKPMTAHNAAAVRTANANGFTINLSANNLKEADKLSAFGLPVVTIVDHDQKTATTTPAGRKVIMCPAAVDATDTISCATCKLCAANNPERPIIGFPVHGQSHKKAAAACKV